MQAIEFLYPIAFLLIPLYLLLDWFAKRYYKRVEFSNVAMLQRAVVKSFDYARVLRFLIVVFIALALAAPVTKHTIKQKSSKGYDISLLLDASDSMSEEHRFDIAKKIVANFIKQRKSDNIALTLFANYAYVASPLTYEKSSLLKVLKYLKLGVAGARDTALYEALFLGADIFKKSEQNNRVMILLTDGINTVKSVSLQSAMERIKKSGIKVYTIALGKKGDYNKEVLEQIAKSSGGKFYQALRPSELELIYNEINKLEAAKIESNTKISYTHYYRYPLMVALLLMLLYGVLYYGTYNRWLYGASILFILAAIYGPQQHNQLNTHKKGGSFAIAIDLSYAMDAEDIYPNRLAFTKAKIQALLKRLSGQKVALYAYAKSGYLITPATDDYDRLSYLVSHLSPVGIKRDRADIKALLESIVAVEQSQNVLLFSATDEQEYTNALEYAKAHGIKLYIYAVATDLGTVIKEDGKVLKRDGHMQVFRLNSGIEELAKRSGGRYWHYTLSDDIDDIIDAVETKDLQSIKSKGAKEIFYIPLLLGFLSFLLALYIRRRG